MKTSVLVLVCCLGSWGGAAINLTVNGQSVEVVPLKVGQSVELGIDSDDGLPYSAYAVFEDAALGTLTNLTKTAFAGNLASMQPVTPPQQGYYVNAAGTNPPPVPGLHFQFTYIAGSVGQTVLNLYDSSYSSVLDSITLIVEPSTAGTGFTYQGRLLEDNQSAQGQYDLVFTLFDAPSAGNVLDSPISLEDVEVVDGYFTVLLDFGNAYKAEARWLETAVRRGNSTESYTTLTPRQRLTPTPLASYAAVSDWENLLNMPKGFADGKDDGLLFEVDPTVPSYLKDGLTWSEITGIPAGFADGVDDGIQTETDPTVPAFLKDGISWSEIMNMPAGFADGVDNDTFLTETQVESFIANDISTGYLPYDNGTKLVSSPLVTNGQEIALGSGVYPDSTFHILTNSDLYGFYVDNTKTSGTNFGIVGAATGNTPGTSYGLYGASLSESGSNFGVYGTATNPSSATNYGVYGTASNSTGLSYAGYFNGEVRVTGILNKDYDLRIASADGAEIAIGAAIDANRKLNLFTAYDTYGIYSEITAGSERYALYGAATGDSTGYSHGVYGISSSGTGHNFGVWGKATTPTAYTNYAIFGEAANTGAGGAFAGYFMGDVRVTGVLNKDYDLTIATGTNTAVKIGTELMDGAKLNVLGSGFDYYGIYSRVEDGGHYPGVDKYGVYGESANPAGYNYGLYGRADTNNTYANYGVYGYAKNDTGAAYAGYFVGTVYVTGVISAGAVVDRTPYPQDLATAYEAVLSMERLPGGQYLADDKEQQLDHSKLSPFIRSEDGHRDLSATVSCLNEVVKDLISKIELQQQQIEAQNRQIQHLAELLTSAQD